MKRLIYHIIYRIPGILLVVLALASAKAQKPVYIVPPVYQCDSYEFSVVDWPGDRYTWDLYRDSTVNFAKAKGDVDPAAYFEKQMYEGSKVTVNWLEPGRYFLRVMVWDEENCTNNLSLFRIDVLPHEMYLEITGDSVCEGELAQLKFVFTGAPPWDGVVNYSNEDGTGTIFFNGETEMEFTRPAPWLPKGEYEFWVMELSDGCIQSYTVPNPEKARVVIFPRPVSQEIKLKGK